MSHAPVMLREVLEALSLKDGDCVLDGTYGGGGYVRGMLAEADCRVLGVDRDLDAITRAEAHAEEDPRLTPLLGRFGDMDMLANEIGVTGVDAIVLDLGVSSFQIDQAIRGFSFMRDGPLDMRMGVAGPSAADVVNTMPERDLAAVIFRLGDEKRSRRIAKAIVLRRADEPFETTADFAAAVETAVGGRKGERIHPATRTFQAIRMFVNDELGEIARGLAAAERLLNEGGRLVVVTFHSLEDRLVKRFLRERGGKLGSGSRHAPERAGGKAATFELISTKAQEPTEAETADNPRARSAKLRAAIRTSAPTWEVSVDTGVALPDFDFAEASA